MDEKAFKWRSRAKKSLEAYFRRRSFPRLTLSLLLILTGVTGFLLSYAMLRLAIDHMWIRYPVATLVSYGVLLALIRAWVAVEQARFDPAAAGVDNCHEEEREFRLQSVPERNHWLDWLNLPDIGCGDLDEGCLPLILVLVLVALIVTIVTTVAAAPVLIAEVFLDAFIVTALYRRLRVAQKEHWLGTALRKTWLAAVAMAVALAIGGWALEEVAPGARSIGKAIEQLRGRPVSP